jgi:hypothetical protein
MQIGGKKDFSRKVRYGMKAIININGLVGGWDLPAFKVSNNEDLTVAFKGLHMSQLYRYLATFKIGAAKSVITLDKDLTATVNSDFLNTQGDVLEVFLEARSAKTDRLLISSNPQGDGFFIEPLKILRFDETLTAVGMLSEINKKMSALDARLLAAEETLREFKEVGVPLPVKTESVELEETVEIEE